MTRTERWFSAVVEMPIELVLLMLIYTVSFWTAVAVRSYDRRHPPTTLGENAVI